jgi:hypothetical protein
VPLYPKEPILSVAVDETQLVVGGVSSPHSFN